LESTAKHFNFHPTYLSSIIKKLTGQRFIDILHEAKLNLASMLLITTDMPINSISNEVGYENTNFFYRIFKKHFGTTPAEYRKNRHLKH
jgi:YesN/AraC family two-component response regulator